MTLTRDSCDQYTYPQAVWQHAEGPAASASQNKSKSGHDWAKTFEM